MLGESEKARLQRIFEWSNRGIGIPEPNRWRDNDQATNEEVQLIRKQGLGRGANAQREKTRTSNDAKSFYSGGLSSQSKRLLEHNLNTSDKPPPANHRRYKHCHSPQTLPSILPSKISSGVELLRQSKENHHHHHHHHKENYHKENHRQHVDKRQESDLKPSRHHHRTSCKSESGLKTKSASRA